MENILSLECTLDKTYDVNAVNGPVVKAGDKVLAEGTDYTLSYVYGEDAETKDFAGAEFVKEGNYTITVTGIGNYEGSTGKAVFTISKNNSASTDPTNPSNPNGDKSIFEALFEGTIYCDRSHYYGIPNQSTLDPLVSWYGLGIDPYYCTS